MKLPASILLACALLVGCATTNTALNSTRDFAVGIYQATNHQIQIAHQRATDFFKGLSPQDKTKVKETRYVAVRTADPTPEQMVAIRKEMKKPGGGRYGKRAQQNPKVYCVMIWDTVAEQVVGENCYAVVDLPQPGLIAKFDVYTAQYVGTL